MIVWSNCYESFNVRLYDVYHHTLAHARMMYIIIEKIEETAVNEV